MKPIEGDSQALKSSAVHENECHSQLFLEKLNKYLFKTVIKMKVFMFLSPSCLEMNAVK